MEKYLRGKEIGSGSFANVYRVQDTKDLTIWVAKVFNKEGANDEAATLKLLSDIPLFGIPSFREAFLYKNRQVIIQEYIAGPTLFEHIVEQKENAQYIPVIAEDSIKSILRQLLFTLRFCHQHGVAHCDLKTDNLVIEKNSRLVLLDFGSSYNIRQAEGDLVAPRGQGNLIFLAPEVLTEQYKPNASYADLQGLEFTATKMREFTSLFPKGFMKSSRLSFRKNYMFKRLHHAQTMFELSKHTENQLAQLWLGAVNRCFQFSKIRVHGSFGSQNPQQIYQHLQKMQEDAVDHLDYDSYPTQNDLQTAAYNLGITQLKAQNLYQFNGKLAADAWGVGMITFLMVFGQRPFQDLNIYQTIHAVQMLAQAIRIQLEETLDLMAGPEEDFQEYSEAVLSGSTEGYHVEIPDGPLSSKIPLELFLLIAMLLHPSPKIRCSVSEALGNPFIKAHEGYENEVHNIVSLPHKLPYDNITRSISKLNSVRSSNFNSQTESPEEGPTGFDEDDDFTYTYVQNPQEHRFQDSEVVVPDDDSISDD